MKLPELKKCPFCAGAAQMMFKPGADFFYVECPCCGARTLGFCIMKSDERKYVTSMFECIESAANAWNKRRYLPE